MKYFITFGTSGHYEQLGKRLIGQINKLSLFDKTILYTDNDIKNDKEFWNRHCDFIEKNPRGYGYWLWKSYIIKKTLEQINNDDILLYFDSSFEIYQHNKPKFLTLFDDVKNSFIIGSYCSVKCIEKVWNKMDLIKYLDMNNSLYMESQQRQAGAIMLIKNHHTVKLINEWYNTSIIYHLIDDSPSIEKNYNGFQEHRHDQSIFSLLTKKYNIYSNIDMFSLLSIIKNKKLKAYLS